MCSDYFGIQSTRSQFHVCVHYLWMGYGTDLTNLQQLIMVVLVLPAIESRKKYLKKQTSQKCMFMVRFVRVSSLRSERKLPASVMSSFWEKKLLSFRANIEMEIFRELSGNL